MGWNIFEEWYCLTPPPPSPSRSPSLPASRPSALKRSPPVGVEWAKGSRDERMIKDEKKNNNNARVRDVRLCTCFVGDEIFFLI